MSAIVECNNKECKYNKDEYCEAEDFPIEVFYHPNYPASFTCWWDDNGDPEYEEEDYDLICNVCGKDDHVSETQARKCCATKYDAWLNAGMPGKYEDFKYEGKWR